MFAATTSLDWRTDAILVASELVANAIAECGECHFSAWYLDDERALRVEVSDASLNMPIEQAADSARVGGHGLRIVQSLSTRWGVNRHQNGKTVWFEIDG